MAPPACLSGSWHGICSHPPTVLSVSLYPNQVSQILAVLNNLACCSDPALYSSYGLCLPACPCLAIGHGFSPFNSLLSLSLLA